MKNMRRTDTKNGNNENGKRKEVGQGETFGNHSLQNDVKRVNLFINN